MKRWLLRIAFAIAVALLLLTIVNASWLASPPPGEIKLIAHRGVAQEFDRTGVGNETCTAQRIEPPVHDYLENTVRSMRAAKRLGAAMVEMDIAPTADGKIAVFHDWTLDCRTNGTGPLREATMARLQSLDPGHGYTSDGGRTYPFRGKLADKIPTLEEALAVLPETAIMFNFKSKDPREADQLAAALKAAGRDVEKMGDAFYGAPGPVERIKQYYPKAWAWSVEAAKRCTTDYFKFGWTTVMPDSCKGGTIIIPLNRQWLAWGWPNRLLSRAHKVGARVIVTGPYKPGEPNAGLTLPEQLGEIPSSFNGYVWVDDMWSVGPALYPRLDFRRNELVNAAEAALERRRKRMAE